MLLASGPGWSALNSFIHSLVPLGIFVVLPIMVVWLILRNHQHEVDKKAEIMLKAIENGSELDTELLTETSRKRTVKDKLLGYLTVAMITGIIGLLTIITEIVLFSKVNLWTDDFGPALLCLIVSGIILAVGIAFLIVYFAGKKTFAKELKALNESEQ